MRLATVKDCAEVLNLVEILRAKSAVILLSKDVQTLGVRHFLRLAVNVPLPVKDAEVHGCTIERCADSVGEDVLAEVTVEGKVQVATPVGCLLEDIEPLREGSGHGQGHEGSTGVTVPCFRHLKDDAVKPGRDIHLVGEGLCVADFLRAEAVKLAATGSRPVALVINVPSIGEFAFVILGGHLRGNLQYIAGIGDNSGIAQFRDRDVRDKVRTESRVILKACRHTGSKEDEQI